MRLSLLLFASTLFAADVTGIWIGQIPNRNGDLLDISFKLTQNGTRIEGKLYGDYGSTPISEGIVAGELITFIVKAPEQAGNQINETRLRFTGRMVGSEIELTRERESSTNAGNSGNSSTGQARGPGRQTFKLKRLV